MKKGYPITIYVAKSKHWFIQSPKLVKKEFLKNHKKDFVICNMDRKGTNKLMKVIKEIRCLILVKKEKAS